MEIVPDTPAAAAPSALIASEADLERFATLPLAERILT
jgi:hypothetical protein